MILYPAIDLIDSQCVRLHQGAYDQKTIYESDPFKILDAFYAAGATWVHVVDLDGARDASKRQVKLIEKMIEHSPLNIQTGGGIRSKIDVQDLIALGAARVIVGSLAVSAPDVMVDLLTHYAPKICLACDVRFLEDTQEWRIATHGWEENSAVPLHDLIARYTPHGLRHILCTDIGRDGTMSGFNADLYALLHQQFPDLNIIASGGFRAANDLDAVQSVCGGAILGKALYEKQVCLDDLIKAYQS